MTRSICFSVLSLLVVASLAFAAEEEQPKEKAGPLLLVLRLQPGETKGFEFEMPPGKFRPGTRDLAFVDILPKTPQEKSKEVWLNGGDFFPLTGGLSAQLQGYGYAFRADKDAKPGRVDLRLKYISFLYSTHAMYLRVYIDEPKAVQQ